MSDTAAKEMLFHLDTSTYVVSKNFEELMNDINCFESNISLWEEKSPAARIEVVREVSRSSHNYLASIFSLIEHIRRLSKKINRSKLNEEYSLRLKLLRKNDVTRFIRELRNYAQHVNLPLIGAVLKYDEIDIGDRFNIRQQILLDKPELLKWDRWSTASIEYIDSHSEIDLKSAMTEYQTLNSEFYIWFSSRISGLYEKELQQHFNARAVNENG